MGETRENGSAALVAGAVVYLCGGFSEVRLAVSEDRPYTVEEVSGLDEEEGRSVRRQLTQHETRGELSG